MTDPTSELLAVAHEIETCILYPLQTMKEAAAERKAWAARIRAALPSPEREAFVAASMAQTKIKLAGTGLPQYLAACEATDRAYVALLAAVEEPEVP